MEALLPQTPPSFTGNDHPRVSAMRFPEHAGEEMHRDVFD